MAEVKLENIRKIYENGFEAVKGISFDIKDREFIVLVGPSGCAKSTTLRMIAGLEEITSGNISIDDEVINDMPPKDRNIAMVFQNYALYPHMSVYENMSFGLKLAKIDKAEIDRRVNEAAEILGITDLLDRKPKLMSGGQRQRVAVGRAIVRKPKVFLFDEPLSNLDAKLRAQMRTEISKLHKKLDATMVYVTHDQVEAMTMADRIVVMKLGEIMQIDSPLNLYHKPENKFVAGFIGSPHMNFFKGTVSKEGDNFIFNDKEFTITLPNSRKNILEPRVGKEIWLGARPEDIHSAADMDKIKNWSKISSKIEVIEPMGKEIVLNLYHPYIETATDCYLAIVGPENVDLRVGDNIELIIDMDKIYLFDVETEKTI